MTLATAQQLLTENNWTSIDDTAEMFNAHDENCPVCDSTHTSTRNGRVYCENFVNHRSYAAVEKFLASDPNDCPLCGDTLTCPMHDLDDGFGV